MRTTTCWLIIGTTVASLATSFRLPFQMARLYEASPSSGGRWLVRGTTDSPLKSPALPRTGARMRAPCCMRLLGEQLGLWATDDLAPTRSCRSRGRACEQLDGGSCTR